MSRSIELHGQVLPPANMLGAAEASLSPSGYLDLMNQTGGLAPTPEQLCAAVELERTNLRAGSLP